MINTYVALDLETTGLSPVNDSIIEIGAIKYINGIETDRLDMLVNPGRIISGRITEITGIDNEMVADAPGIGEIIDEVMDFLKDSVLLGHNIIFDYSFLKKAAADAGYDYTTQGIDTHKVSRKVLPQLESRSLESLCEYFSIETTHHRALADAESAALIYNRMCEINDLDNPAMELVFKIPKQEPITWKQVNFLTSLVNRYGVNLDCEIEDLTKSQASREIDNILSTYGMKR